MPDIVFRRLPGERGLRNSVLARTKTHLTRHEECFCIPETKAGSSVCARAGPPHIYGRVALVDHTQTPETRASVEANQFVAPSIEIAAKQGIPVQSARYRLTNSTTHRALTKFWVGLHCRPHVQGVPKVTVAPTSTNPRSLKAQKNQPRYCYSDLVAAVAVQTTYRPGSLAAVLDCTRLRSSVEYHITIAGKSVGHKHRSCDGGILVYAKTCGDDSWNDLPLVCFGESRQRRIGQGAVIVLRAPRCLSQHAVSGHQAWGGETPRL